jgi:hypothetical protein
MKNKFDLLLVCFGVTSTEKYTTGSLQRIPCPTVYLPEKYVPARTQELVAP